MTRATNGAPGLTTSSDRTLRIGWHRYERNKLRDGRRRRVVFDALRCFEGVRPPHEGGQAEELSPAKEL